jgi:hypothetical protein
MQENGNSIVEFISFLLLALVPIFSFFSWMTIESNQRLRDNGIFHEVIRIVKSGDELSQSIGIANRFLTLHNSDGALYVRCLAGNCPHRGSQIQVRYINGKRTYETTVVGGLWS